MAKPLRFHHTLNQAPRSPKHGQHRRTSPATHRHSADRAGDSSGRSDQVDAITIAWTNFNTTWIESIEPKPPAIPHAGIRTGELIGHRLWWVLDGGYLSSLAHLRKWMPGETVHGDTNKLVGDVWLMWPPIWGGTYAFSDAGQLEPEIQKISRALDATGAVIAYPFGRGFDIGPGVDSFVSGTIKMWGDVVEHEHGYRAEFAKINSIDAIYGPRDIEATRALYGVGAQTSHLCRTD